MPIFNFDDNILFPLADLVLKQSGITFRDSNLSVLTSRLSNKLREKNIDAQTYLSLLQNDKDELLSFIDFITTNFTSFFRNKRHFDILKNHVLPEVIAKHKEDRHIKVWSAGSSTGEEAYSIAIIIDDYFQKQNIDIEKWKIEIIGSDISLESLFTAREGKYPAKSLQKIPEDFRQRYFASFESGSFYIVKDFLRKNVRFDYHNLIYDPTIRSADIVFFRNVMIYFDKDIQKKVLEKIYLACAPGAALFVGHSESLLGLFDGFSPRKFDEGIYYVKK